MAVTARYVALRSIERLVRILNALDQRVELRITKAPGRVRKAA